MILSIDTETTGLDFYHNAKPFLVTTCNEKDEQQWWEWPVDPFTREPIIPKKDIKDIQDLVNAQDIVVLQNAKFDVTALTRVGFNPKYWPWSKTHDTLRMGHLLASNQPHGLTSMSLVYLGVNLQHFEDDMQVIVKELRTLCKRDYSEWKLAKKDQEGMPSAKEKTWKYDLWLPRAIAREQELVESHEYWTITSNYANSDSWATINLFKRFRELIEERGYWRIYEETIKTSKIAFQIEKVGVTVNGNKLYKMESESEKESSELNNKCTAIALKKNFILELPKGASNNSLRSFCFDILNLPHVAVSEKTGAPSLDAECLETYSNTLPQGSSLDFVNYLIKKRKIDTGIAFMKSYQRYWLSLGNNWYILHPSLNSTGTSTLRWSSSNPNEQQISKQEESNIRSCFGPKPGREWWSLDAKNIELRIPAYVSGEQSLIDLFEKSEEPPYYGSEHLLTFHKLHTKLWDEAVKKVGWANTGPYCKKEYASTWYQRTKNGNFAVQYGAVDKKDGTGTADRAYGIPGAHSRLKQAFPKKEALNRACIQHAKDFGYVETIPDKTVDPNHGYPLLCTRTNWGGILETVPLSYYVQGSAMWWTMKAMIRTQSYLDRLNEKVTNPSKAYHMVMQVHDECVFDFPKGTGPKPWLTNLPKIRKIQYLMSEGGNDLGIPTPVSCEYHTTSWKEGLSV